ncbi:MAG: sialidase family protein [Acidimicrobiales bacterium]
MRRRLALAVGAAAMVATGPGLASAADPPRLTEPVRATVEDLAPARTYTAPYLLIDPEDSDVVYAAAAELRSRTCRVLRSGDAGLTWKLLDGLPSPKSYPFCSTSSGMLTQTPMAWGRDRSLYYAMSGWDAQDGGPGGSVSVILAKSTDFGDTWNSTVVRDARGKTGPETESHSAVAALVVDSESAARDIVYVGWRASYPQAPALPGGLRALRPPLVAVSTDGGQTFGPPIDVSSFYKKTIKGPTGADLPIGMGFTAPSLTLDDKGTLYVLYPAAAPAAFPPSAEPDKLSMLLAKSTDQGKTFTVTEVGAPLNHNEGVQIIKWTPAGGASGTLHALYEDKPDQTARSADRDIYYQRSTDGGTTWSEPKRLNDDNPADLRVQVTPNLSVTDEGRVDAVWWDFRLDPGSFVNDVYLSTSEDNGVTFGPNLRITDQSINRKLGVWSNGYDIRQPPGIVATDELTIIAWDDTRLSTPVTEGQDIFVRAAQFKALPASESVAARYALAAVIGLAVAGLVLLLLGARRRMVSPAAAPATRPPAKVS